MDWDGLRIVLALFRHGSVRAAANHLEVSHSTVARRIEAFEKRLGVRLFDRTHDGYVLTAAGEEMVAVAIRTESEMDALERRLAGKDARIAGSIRFTAPDVLLCELLMPDLVSFVQRYPKIELEIKLSYQRFDLSRREADVAIRALRYQKAPPEHLVGRRLVTSYYASYASRAYLNRVDLHADPPQACWLGWANEARLARWVRESPYPDIPIRGKLYDAASQRQAAHHGMGLAYLPCIAGDTDPMLVRLPGEPIPAFDVWMISHPDLRHTARLRMFREFVADVIMAQRDLFEGRRRSL